MQCHNMEWCICHRHVDGSIHKQQRLEWASQQCSLHGHFLVKQGQWEHSWSEHVRLGEHWHDVREQLKAFGVWQFEIVVFWGEPDVACGGSEGNLHFEDFSLLTKSSWRDSQCTMLWSCSCTCCSRWENYDFSIDEMSFKKCTSLCAALVPTAWRVLQQMVD